MASSRAALEIRRRRAADSRGMRGVARATWRDTYEAIAPAGFIRAVLRGGYDRGRLLRGLADPRRDAFVAEEDGRIVGYADLVESPPGTAELARIYVLPDMQGTGVGLALLEAALEAARARGVREVGVFVDAANARSIAWYRRQEFRDAGPDVFTLGPWTRPVLRLVRSVVPEVRGA